MLNMHSQMEPFGASEFQKLIDNPGVCLASITCPLARLQLGRAQRLMGDNASAESYEESDIVQTNELGRGASERLAVLLLQLSCVAQETFD